MLAHVVNGSKSNSELIGLMGRRARPLKLLAEELLKEAFSVE
jgi:hypothetical protein